MWVRQPRTHTQSRIDDKTNGDGLVGAKKQVVRWSAARFSHGSQLSKQTQPPWGFNFFASKAVRKRLADYPVLHNTWKRYGSKKNLEHFWDKLDRDFNNAKRFSGSHQSELKESLIAVANRPAHNSLKAYYKFYMDRFNTDASRSARAVAGFELKALLLDVLLGGPKENKLLFFLWRAMECPFRILTFNYDLYAEISLYKTGRQLAYEPTLSAATVDCLKPHGSLQWVHRKYALRDGQFTPWYNVDKKLARTLTFKPLTPSSYFGRDPGNRRCLYLNDPLMIGLRQKREFTRKERNPLVRQFFSNLLRDSQEMLKDAEKIIVIGFAFEKNYHYLQGNLSGKQTGCSKRLLCCYKSRYGKERDYGYEEKVQEFFGAKADFCHIGFGDRFIERVKSFLLKK